MTNCTNLELLTRLKKFNDDMELIFRNLENYLAIKRNVFPRFCFLSNDELLEMLSDI